MTELLNNESSRLEYRCNTQCVLYVISVDKMKIIL